MNYFKQQTRNVAIVMVTKVPTHPDTQIGH